MRVGKVRPHPQNVAVTRFGLLFPAHACQYDAQVIACFRIFRTELERFLKEDAGLVQSAPLHCDQAQVFERLGVLVAVLEGPMASSCHSRQGGPVTIARRQTRKRGGIAGLERKNSSEAIGRFIGPAL